MYYGSLYKPRRPPTSIRIAAALVANLKEPGRIEATKALIFASQAPCEARIPKVHAPVLVVMGTRDSDFDDPAAEADWVATHLHGKKLMVDGAGHYPHVEYPDVVATAVIGFMKEAQDGEARGIDKDAVVRAAAKIADDHGWDALTLARVAKKLRVRSPSLYNHVGGLEGLRRELKLLALRDLNDGAEPRDDRQVARRRRARARRRVSRVRQAASRNLRGDDGGRAQKRSRARGGRRPYRRDYPVGAAAATDSIAAKDFTPSARCAAPCMALRRSKSRVDSASRLTLIRASSGWCRRCSRVCRPRARNDRRERASRLIFTLARVASNGPNCYKQAPL